MATATAPALEELRVPFRDVRSASLRWALALPRRSALAERHLDVAGIRVELRILGASHQVVLERDDAVVLSETVACDLPGAQAMPSRTAVEGYSFSSRTELLAPDALAERVAELTARLAGPDPDREQVAGIGAAFPGDPLAVTGLVLHLDRGRLAWESWHAYPQAGELVHTLTEVIPEVIEHG